MPDLTVGFMHPQAARPTLVRAAKVLDARIVDDGFTIGRYTLRMIDPATIEIMNAGEGGHFDVHEMAAAITRFLKEHL